jgi:DNA-binding SARP family transcriptional activator
MVQARRERLDPGRGRGDDSFIAAIGGGYVLDRRRVRIDADEFEREVDAGRAAFAAGLRESAVQRLQTALALYRGDFLEEETYSEWALDERNRLREVAVRALEIVAGGQRACDDLDGASETLRRLARLAPYDADIERHLIELCIRRGRRTEALRRYMVLQARMWRDFGEELEFTLSDLTIVTV